MHEQTSVSREQASTLLSELKTLYSAMPMEVREVVKSYIATSCIAVPRSMGQST